MRSHRIWRILPALSATLFFDKWVYRDPKQEIVTTFNLAALLCFRDGHLSSRSRLVILRSKFVTMVEHRFIQYRCHVL